MREFFACADVQVSEFSVIEPELSLRFFLTYGRYNRCADVMYVTGNRGGTLAPDPGGRRDHRLRRLDALGPKRRVPGQYRCGSDVAK